MSTPDLSKASCNPFFKAPRAPKAKKKSAADKREGMSERHLELIRQLPCCVCGEMGTDMNPIEAHHLKISAERGMGMRATDKWAVPLHHEEHINGVERVGSRNELKWFQSRGVHVMDLAAGIWLVTGKLEAMLAVMRAHKERRS